jgi:hypothetical protein
MSDLRRNPAALLPLFLLFAACASKDQFGIATQHFLSDCQHGDVEITVGLGGTGTTGEDRNDPLTYNVEVANNARKDIVVKTIRVEAEPSEIILYRLDHSFREFNQLIAENDEFVFELPTTGHGAPNRSPGQEQRYGQNAIQVTVTVTLEGGDEYRCRYALPAPR